MRYNPQQRYEFRTARLGLITAFRDFRLNLSEETDRALLESIALYERVIPERIRIEAVARGGKNLVFLARLRLEQYHNACFANK